MSYSPKNANGQATMANSEPVVIASDQSAVPVSAASLPLPSGAATSAKQDTGNTSLASIDGKVTACNTGAVVISSGSVTADTELTTADLDTGAGTDTRAVVGLVGSKSGGAQLIPGDATAGLKVDLGADNDVTLATLPDTASGDLATINSNTDSLSVVGGGTEATAIRVTIANDSTGVVSVDDNGGTLTVDASQLDIDNLNATDDIVTVTGGAGQTADVKVTLDSEAVVLGAGSAAIGKLAANSGVDIGDVDVTSAVITGGGVADDGTTPGNPIMIGGKAVETDGTDPTSVSAEGDVAILRTDRNRLLIVNQTHPRFWHVSADYASAQTNTSIKAAPGASLSLYITDISISNGATAGNITLLDGSGGTVLYEIYPAINGGSNISLRSPIKLTANTALCITSTTVTTHSIFVSGYIAP